MKACSITLPARRSAAVSIFHTETYSGMFGVETGGNAHQCIIPPAHVMYTYI